MKRIFAFVAVLCLLGATGAFADGSLTVMTRNLYLGADLAPVFAAETPEEFSAAAQTALEQVAASNFPERARALATEIAEKQPHLVGLQEVFNFTFNGSNGPPPYRDLLKDLMDALTAQGADYTVAAVVRDTDLQVSLGGNLVGVVDRDVILARGDVAASIVPVSLSGCRPSLDGCNYQVVAGASTPAGIITIERGFVAVDAFIGNGPVRFVNTHLEDRSPDPANPLSPAIQAAQAFELLSVLAGFPNPQSAKIIVVGDINSSPQDPTLTVGPYTIVPPYKQLADEGYADTWNLRPGNPPGFTCCQAGDLLNLESILRERIDVIFTNEEPAGQIKVNVTGNDESDRTPSGLWPSDHAGVVTRM
ncbi:MAG: endonuclease/exonuclease/phosphatase family protein [Nitrospirota bacterium]